MAYCGDFKPFFQYIADSIYTYASQRDRQKGEAFVHGYTLALTSQCSFYRPISELDNQNGYADIFLRPLPTLCLLSESQDEGRMVSGFGSVGEGERTSQHRHELP